MLTFTTICQNDYDMFVYPQDTNNLNYDTTWNTVRYNKFNPV